MLIQPGEAALMQAALQSAAAVNFMRRERPSAPFGIRVTTNLSTSQIGY